MNTNDENSATIRNSAQRISTFLQHLKFLLSEHDEDLELGDVDTLVEHMFEAIEHETTAILSAIE